MNDFNKWWITTQFFKPYWDNNSHKHEIEYKWAKVGWNAAKSEAADRIEELEAREAKLVDFCIWLTGCGYDFTKHDYFCQQRDKLLKGK